MTVVFACGGTGGHINPAIAVADTIRKYHPDAKISFIGNENGMESRLVPAAGYDFYPIHVAGFQRKISLKNIARNISAAKKAVTSGFEAAKILKKLQPDLVVGMGGYVSGPVVRKAHKMGFKTATHEQNAFPGVTTKMLMKHVDLVMLAMPDAQKHLPKGDYVITGNPVRPEILAITKEQAREKLGIRRDLPFILSFGGSLGAKCINHGVSHVMAWHWNKGIVYHYHASGKSGKDWMPEYLGTQGVDLNRSPLIRLTEYIYDMDLCMAAADLVICRAGAITLSELEAQGKASIIIPSPYVGENHQYHNAMTLVNRGAAAIIEEKDMNDTVLVEKVKELLKNKSTLEQMGNAARQGAIVDANDRIYTALMNLL